MRCLRLPYERRIVERELFKRFFERLVLVALDREKTREDHGLCLPVAGKRLCGTILCASDGVAHLHLTYILQTSDKVSYLADTERIKWCLGGPACADLLDDRICVSGHHLDPRAALKLAVYDTHKCDNTAIRIEVAIKDECCERRVRITCRSWYVIYNRFQQIMHAHASLSRR